MKNLRNIFKEYNDPKIYRDLKIGFACLIVLGILITFAVSPSLRHEIGIGNNHAISTPKVHHTKVHHPPDIHLKKKSGRSGHQKAAQGHSKPTQGNPSSKGHRGLEGVKPPSAQHEEPGSGVGNPGPSPAPKSPPPSTPSPSHPSEGNGGGSTSGGGKSVSPEVEAGAKGKVIEIPNLEIPPIIEETTHGVNKTVNGVTGTLEESTKSLPVHTELPEVCVIKC